MIVPVLSIGGISIWGINSSTARFKELADDQVDQTVLILAVRDQLITAESYAMRYVQQARSSAKVYYLDLEPRIVTSMNRLTVMMAWPAAHKLVDDIQRAWSVARPVALKALKAPPGSAATGHVYLLDEFHPMMDEAIGKLGDLNQVNLDHMDQEVSKLSTLSDRILTVIIAAFLAALALTVLITRAIGHRVKRSLLHLEEGARYFEIDDFTHRIELPREREFVSVATALNSMAEQVSQGKTAQAELEDELRHQALHDPLTGLANRPLLADRVHTALLQVQRANCSVGILFLDVDDFKNVNDTFGHAVGDELLKGIALRLESCLRESDTAARIGGDEFAVLVQNMRLPKDANIMAERILEAFSFPFVIGAKEFEVHPSIGIASSSDPATSGAELMRRADVAMYNAKRGGKNKAVCFADEMDDDILGDANLRVQIRRALERDEFVAFYQPIVDLTSGGIQGAEALIRWDHPSKGLLTPDRFLPTAEEMGVIDEIDIWMLDQACAQGSAWGREGESGLTMSVNVSTRMLTRADFPEIVEKALLRSSFPAQNLVIEITEAAYVHNAAAANLAEVKRHGVNVAIDDFGTGYCSLNYLRRFPIDVLKIDKSFIDAVAEDPEAGALAKAIVTLAEAMNLRTVAEGIEDTAQLDTLCGFGVGSGQGYLFAKPVDADSFGELLQTGVETREVIAL